MGWPALTKKAEEPQAPPPPPPPPAPKPFLDKITTKHVWDDGKKELRSRTELKLGKFEDAKFGLNYSDKSGLVSVDLERGALKLGYDLQRKDLAVQFKRDIDPGKLTVKQVVPGLKWELVPSPVVELETKLLDRGKLKDKLKLVYDYQNRLAYYAETLKYNKQFKLRIGGDNKTSDHALCVGWKPDTRWAKSLKLTHTAADGPIISYKVKPAKGWKVHAEAATKSKLLTSSVTYKALGGDAELVFDAAVPLDGKTNLGEWRFLRKSGLKVQFQF